MTNGAMRTMVAVLASSLGTGTASWFAFGADRPNRTEVGEMIQTQSPYVRDKRFLNEAIVQLTETTSDLRAVVSDLTAETVELRTVLTMAIERP